MSTKVKIFSSLILLVSPHVLVSSKKRKLKPRILTFLMFPNNLFMVGLLFFRADFKIIFFDELYSDLLAFIKIKLYFLTGSKEDS